MTRPIEEIEKMAEMNKTMSLGQIGEVYGIDRTNVGYLLRSRGFTPINHTPRKIHPTSYPAKTRDRGYTEEERAELVGLLNSGLTYEEIGKEKGVTKQRVQQMIKEMDIKKTFY